jgi:hypothetical protein
MLRFGSSKPKMMDIPGFSYLRSKIPAIIMPGEAEYLIQNLGTEKTAEELSRTGITQPLLWRRTLYHIGMDIEYDLNQEHTENLPDSVKSAARMVYRDMHRRKEFPPSGAWHNDFVLLLEKEKLPKGMMWPEEGFVPAIYFREVEGLKRKGSGYEIIPTADTKEIRTVLPNGISLIVPTTYGMFDQETGLPLFTVSSEGEAFRLWEKAGFTEAQTRSELSMFYRGDSGLRAVLSFSGGRLGPGCISLSSEPSGKLYDFGSAPASRRR